MTAFRLSVVLIAAFAAWGAAAPLHAEGLSASTRNSQGLNLGRDNLIGSFWGLELGQVERPRLVPAEQRSQGLNVSLVGTAPLGPSFGVFGKLGASYGRGDTATMGVPGESSTALAWGAGVSYSFTPRLSATLEWDSNDPRFMGNVREPVRSTSLGLRWRY